jgi:hypothetical protein
MLRWKSAENNKDMPFFKRKQERSGRLDELEAHVKKIRRIAKEEPNGAYALQSFLIEDGYWERQETALQAQHELEVTKKKGPQEPPSPAIPPAAPPAAPEAGVVTSASIEHAAPRTEDEAILEAELQRYLARIAEETEPDPDSDDYDRYER